ncbi:MAG: cell division protein FtsX, partial [Polyangia bacterium]
MSFARNLERALAGARQSPLIQLVAVGTIALSLLLVGVVELTALNVRRVTRGWGGDVQMTVYLEDGVSPARAQRVAAALARLPGVVGVRTVDAHEAWGRL